MDYHERKKVVDKSSDYLLDKYLEYRRKLEESLEKEVDEDEPV